MNINKQLKDIKLQNKLKLLLLLSFTTINFYTNVFGMVMRNLLQKNLPKKTISGRQ